MILRNMLKAKIHRAVVTSADANYVGSLTIDRTLMEASGIRQYEMVQIANIDNGYRLETYVIEGERNSGIIGANGAAARLLNVGDRIIIMAFAQVSEPVPDDWSPVIILVNEENQITEIR